MFGVCAIFILKVHVGSAAIGPHPPGSRHMYTFMSLETVYFGRLLFAGSCCLLKATAGNEYHRGGGCVTVGELNAPHTTLGCYESVHTTISTQCTQQGCLYVYVLVSVGASALKVAVLI